MSNNGSISSPTDAETRKPRRWVMVLLAVSLALNLLVAGAVGGRIFSNFMGMHKARTFALARPGAMVFAGYRLMRELPRERRTVLRRLVRERRGDIREAYRNVAEARLELARAIAREPFDEAAYKQAMASVQEAEAMARARVLALTDALIRALTPAERRLYVQKLREAAEHRRHRARFWR